MQKELKLKNKEREDNENEYFLNKYELKDILLELNIKGIGILGRFHNNKYDIKLIENKIEKRIIASRGYGKNDNLSYKEIEFNDHNNLDFDIKMELFPKTKEGKREEEGFYLSKASKSREFKQRIKYTDYYHGLESDKNAPDFFRNNNGIEITTVSKLLVKDGIKINNKGSTELKGTIEYLLEAIDAKMSKNYINPDTGDNIDNIDFIIYTPAWPELLEIIGGKIGFWGHISGKSELLNKIWKTIKGSDSNFYVLTNMIAPDRMKKELISKNIEILEECWICLDLKLRLGKLFSNK